MGELSSSQLDGVASWSQWMVLIAGIITAISSITNYLASEEKDRRTDLRVATNERLTAEAKAAAAGANLEAGKARSEAAHLQRQSSALQAQAADLGRKAAEAELQTERLRQRIAWRFIDDQHAQAWVQSASAFAGQKYELLTGDEREARALTRSVDTLLHLAGWVRQPPPQDYPIAGDVPAAIVSTVGVEIIIAPGAATRPAAESLKRSFDAANLPATLKEHAALTVRADVIAVIVGAKPQQPPK